MIKTSIAIAGALLLMTTVTDTMASDVKTAHAFTFQAIDGGDLPLSRFAGKAVLVVNTASNCGFTPQYSALQDVWSRYRDKGLVVLGVPSNDFGGQEPGSAMKIKEFCEVNFNVDFPMTGKVRIRDDTPHPFYAWALKELGGIAKPRWNFHKYLVAPDGRLVEWFSSPTSPLSKKVIKAIEANLPG